MPWVEILAYLTPRPVAEAPVEPPAPAWVTPTLRAAVKAKLNG